MVNYSNLQISKHKAQDLLRDLFNISGNISPLPGDSDFNFRVGQDDGDGHILKISRPGEDENYLDFQQQLLTYIDKNQKDLISPKVVKDKNGNPVSSFLDAFGNQRSVRLLTWVSGRLWSSVNPQRDGLRYSLGEQCGRLTSTLQGFDHPQAHRELEWDVAKSLWTENHLDLFTGDKREIILYFQEKFKRRLNSYNKLRKSVVHNDANDNNIIVDSDLISPRVKAVIDYGDTVYTQIVNDVAIACVYAIMQHNDPLEAALPIVKGYHASFPLKVGELEHLYNAIAMRLVVSVTKSALNKIAEPENEYLLISEKPAWDLLQKWRNIDSDFAHFSFRHACGLPAHPDREKYDSWASKNNFSLVQLFPTIAKNIIHSLDLSVSSTWLGHQREFEDLDLFQFKIDRLQKKMPKRILAGGYLEPRAVYNSEAYDKIGNNGRQSRTIHLGIDFWLPAKTPVHTILDGEVVTAVDNSGAKEYGGLVILKHKIEDLVFYTLYGHLSVESATWNKVGDQLKAGDRIGLLGETYENGNWATHLHFQTMLSLLDYEDDFPGVAYFDQVGVWENICPDPNLLFRSDALAGPKGISNNSLIEYRREHLGKSLSLQYEVPIKMVRGAGQYLIDQYGRKYLDTVNNVAHVGHEHYAVVRAGQEQMALINTNSRYLHENINALAQELLATLPSELSVLHFVNSGSEANELAIRMVKAATGQRDIIASEMGYHGNSNMCIDISSYKFDGKGGQGAPEHTHIFPLPDAFRGKYRGADAGDRYAEEVREQIQIVHKKGRGVGALIVEPIISCGGQIELPEGFLAKAYKFIRAAGGLCISDEVQVGCGRMGKTFWGFQLYGVVPDIVTIGKPLGNGHPLAAVACTRQVADKFANGMEYFNTFGGNPVSCAIGTEVLRTVKRERLQENALEVGEFLKSKLKLLAREFPIIGDVRGQGLFLGFELVDREMEPLGNHADYLANRMKDHGILMSTDGSDHNVLKIKPPLVFTKGNAEELIYYLRKILAEDFMQTF